MPEPDNPQVSKEAFYQRFPATTVEGGSEEEEPALPTDQEFLAGFNVRPRIIVVGTKIGEEIQSVMRFLSTHGVSMQGHEFQYFQSPGGDELVHRWTVGTVVGPNPSQRSTASGYRPLDELAAYVEDDTVRGWISEQGLADKLPFHPE
jgi:hypothetical protein